MRQLCVHKKKTPSFVLHKMATSVAPEVVEEVVQVEEVEASTVQDPVVESSYLKTMVLAECITVLEGDIR